MQTIRDLVIGCKEKYGPHTAFQMRAGEAFRKISHEQVLALVASITAKLVELGIKPQDRVALLSENRPDWPICYLAIASYGATNVPFDPMSSKEDLLGLMRDSGSCVLIVSEKFHELAVRAKAEVPGLKIFISLDIEDDSADFLSYKKIISKPADPIIGNPSSEDLASIVYTSGTTGIAKGVMLSHGNIISNITSVAELFDIGPGDQFLSILPLYHTFETSAGFLAPFYKGACITYSEGLKSTIILKNMQDTGTTIMCGVPLFYKILYDGIMRAVEEKGLFARGMFSALIFISELFKSLLGVSIARLLFNAIHKKFGGKLRFFVSGGAALDPEIIYGFASFGITVLQGYGLTESSPILTADTLSHNRVGSVGQAIPGVELKIIGENEAGIGEVIACGPNIMKGYYKRQDLTDEVIHEGWLHTGDLGYLDQEKYLFICGRLKNVIITGAGINVYPEEVEFQLGRIPGIKESCVLGKKSEVGSRKGMEEVFVVIVPDMEYFERYAKDNVVELTQKLVEQTIREGIFELNERLADFNRISDFIIRFEDLPKTSTRKVKRFVVERQLKESKAARNG